MNKVSKVVFIFARLINDPEAYEGKTNEDIEREILEEIGPIPYVARIEKVTVLDWDADFSRGLGFKSPKARHAT